MASVEEQVVARIEVIAQGLAVLGGRVYRDRQDAFTREESPALLLEHVDGDSQPFGGPRGPFTPVNAVELTEVRVACIVCVRNGNWQTVADDARVQLHALLMADATLRGLISELRRDRCEWKAASADQPFGYAAQVYVGKTLTRAHALDALAA